MRVLLPDLEEILTEMIHMNNERKKITPKATSPFIFAALELNR